MRLDTFVKLMRAHDRNMVFNRASIARGLARLARFEIPIAYKPIAAENDNGELHCEKTD